MRMRAAQRPAAGAATPELCALRGSGGSGSRMHVWLSRRPTHVCPSQATYWLLMYIVAGDADSGCARLRLHHAPAQQRDAAGAFPAAGACVAVPAATAGIGTAMLLLLLPLLLPVLLLLLLVLL